MYTTEKLKGFLVSSLPPGDASHSNPRRRIFNRGKYNTFPGASPSREKAFCAPPSLLHGFCFNKLPAENIVAAARGPRTKSPALGHTDGQPAQVGEDFKQRKLPNFLPGLHLSCFKRSPIQARGPFLPDRTTYYTCAKPARASNPYGAASVQLRSFEKFSAQAGDKKENARSHLFCSTFAWGGKGLLTLATGRPIIQNLRHESPFCSVSQTDVHFWGEKNPRYDRWPAVVGESMAAHNPVPIRGAVDKPSPRNRRRQITRRHYAHGKIKVVRSTKVTVPAP